MNTFGIVNYFKNSIILKNSFYTFFIQLSNYLIPLIILPYLTRTLGIENYGKITFTQSFVLFANTLCEYGFSLSATREISKNKDEISLLSEITYTTIYSKLFLLIVTIVIIAPTFFLIPIFHNDINYFYISIFLLFAMTLNTDWFFLGIESVKESSISLIISKFILLLLTFLYVKNADDVYLFLTLFGLSLLLPNILNLYLVYVRTQFTKIGFKKIIKFLKESVHLFIFKFMVSLYTNANTFIVGLILNPTQVGIYAGAEKITKSFVNIWTPISQVLYPRINNILAKDYKKARSKINAIILLYGITSTIFMVFLILTAKYLTLTLLGESFNESTNIIKILSPIVVLIALSNATGILWLIPLKKDKQFNIIISITGLANLVTSVPLTFYFGPNGMAISILISELFVTLSCLYLFNKSFKVNNV